GEAHACFSPGESRGEAEVLDPRGWRQVQRGDGTAALAVVQRCVAVVQLGHLGDEAQPQATAAAAAVRARQRVEALEHAAGGVIGYARTTVAYRQSQCVACAPYRHFNTAAARCEIDRVVEQVGQRLPQQEGI